ncbi:MAG: hypothetical protein NXI04_16610 [Planctomycetaceae bacterium]|nr:hypothetical protein [Planctomycetaceae bacterium]
MQQERITADDRVRYADDDYEYGSVAELLEAMSADDADLYDAAQPEYVDDHSEPRIPPSTVPRSGRSVMQQLQDGMRNVRNHRQRVLQSSPRTQPGIVNVTIIVARLFVVSSALAGLWSWLAYSRMDSSSGMAAVADKLQAEASLYACISCACLATFTFGWAFLLQTVWKIRQSVAPNAN